MHIKIILYNAFTTELMPVLRNSTLKKLLSAVLLNQLQTGVHWNIIGNWITGRKQFGLHRLSSNSRITLFLPLWRLDVNQLCFIPAMRIDFFYYFSHTLVQIHFKAYRTMLFLSYLTLKGWCTPSPSCEQDWCMLYPSVCGN